jgi:hypothetical protein
MGLFSKSTPRPMVRIHDLSTDEVIDREMNDAEFAQYEAEQTANAENIVAAEAKAAQKTALLERLGITEEEAQLLLGGN